MKERLSSALGACFLSEQKDLVRVYKRCLTRAAFLFVSERGTQQSS